MRTTRALCDPDHAYTPSSPTFIVILITQITCSLITLAIFNAKNRIFVTHVTQQESVFILN